jgi:hypothetical protein
MDPEKPKCREAQAPILDSIPGVIQVRQVCVFDRSSTGPPGARFDLIQCTMVGFLFVDIWIHLKIISQQLRLR